jgi:hypothetical protein
MGGLPITQEAFKAAYLQALALSGDELKRLVKKSPIAFVAGITVGMSNRPDPRTLPKPKDKTGEFICQCGCGQSFFAVWKTKPPSYANNTHKQRAYRSRLKAKALLKNGLDRN